MFNVGEILHTLAGGMANSLPNSSKVMLSYNLLADSMLCSITARSRILEPTEVEKRQHIQAYVALVKSCPKKTNNYRLSLRDSIEARGSLKAFIAPMILDAQ